ncbi:hypothetical protein O3P69_005171 [Scylla paramamosain]|uniref:Uncharacterized protein n=1 Tax=Scylla paramamosain TaxID=85552 RepID=A0AAW0UA71_SCYPA
MLVMNAEEVDRRNGCCESLAGQSIVVLLEVLPRHQQEGVFVHVFWSHLWSSFGTIFVFASPPNTIPDSSLTSSPIHHLQVLISPLTSANYDTSVYSPSTFPKHAYSTRREEGHIISARAAGSRLIPISISEFYESSGRLKNQVL